LLEEAPASADGHLRLTEAGRAAMREMAEARRAELERFLDDWQPAQHREVQQLLERFAQSLRALPPAGEPAPA
jgi:DNA-binding MarR family transcriptional regulator